MPRKKVDENHKITDPDFIEETVSSTEDTDVYAEDMSPLADDSVEESSTPETAKEPDFIKLVLAKGATFTSGGKIYNKGVLEPVPPDIADKLMKTGFFERA